MIAVEAVRSAHDQIMGGIVVAFVAAMVYRPTRRRAMAIAGLGFVGAVLVEMKAPGLVDGRP